MFTLARPAAAAIEQQIAAATGLTYAPPRFLTLSQDRRSVQRLPPGFARDFKSSCLGRGLPAFAAARRAFEQWAMFDLEWVRIANPEARIIPGQVVAVEVRSVGLWSVNLSRVVEIIDRPAKFGFIYATTSMHVEEGEERFLLDFDEGSGDIRYELEAVSRPRHGLARIGFPITRAFQHRFARDSHRRMQREISKMSASAS